MVNKGELYGFSSSTENTPTFWSSAVLDQLNHNRQYSLKVPMALLPHLISHVDSKILLELLMFCGCVRHTLTFFCLKFITVVDKIDTVDSQVVTRS